MIGVALVVFVGVFASSIRASFTDTLDRQFVGDVAIVNTDGFSPIPIEDRRRGRRGSRGSSVVSPMTLDPRRDRPGRRRGAARGDRSRDSRPGRQPRLDARAPTRRSPGSAPTRRSSTRTSPRTTASGSATRSRSPGRAATWSRRRSRESRTRSRFIVDKVALTRDTVRDRLGARDDSTTFVNFADGTDPAADTRADRRAALRALPEHRGALPGGVQGRTARRRSTS